MRAPVNAALEKRRKETNFLKDNIPFVDLGSEYYNQFNKERKINVYLKKLKALGWESDTAAVSLPA